MSTNEIHRQTSKRGRKRTSNRVQYTCDDLKAAVDLVMTKKWTERQAAKEKNIPQKSFNRYMKKVKNGSISVTEPILAPLGSKTIIPRDLEDMFVDYVKFRAKICYGMTSLEVRKAAYQLVVQNNVNVPVSWAANQCAGDEWFILFRVRHPSLSLRKPEACSLSRATAFNKHNVKAFYDNLENVFKKFPSVARGTRIFNLDETALTTVQTPQKVVAGKETRRLNRAVSAERGNFVTGCCIISANGAHLPPALVFPRQLFKRLMLNGAPEGSLGLAQKTGWMTNDLFLEVMKHFVQHSNSSPDNRSLLIYDNHESHLTLEVINYARANGVVIVTIPPHCSNRLQPLDVGVYRSLKNSYNASMDSWMLMHPGQTVTIYEIAAIFNTAFTRSMTPSNIIASFKSTGIFPYDRDLFSEEDFACSFVTDRPAEIPALSRNGETNSIAEPSVPVLDSFSEQANQSFSTNDSFANPQPSTSNGSNDFVSPTDILGLPKAKPRKQGENKRVRKTIVATDTPEKLELEKKRKLQMLKKRKGDTAAAIPKKRGRNTKAQLHHEKGSSSEDDDLLPLEVVQMLNKRKTNTTNAGDKTKSRKRKVQLHHEKDSSSEDDEISPLENEAGASSATTIPKKRGRKAKVPAACDEASGSNEEILPQPNSESDRDFRKDDYCIVKFDMQETDTQKHYVGKILSVTRKKSNYKMSFLRRSVGINRFVFPQVADIEDVRKSNILCRVNPILVSNTTSRQNRTVSFCEDLLNLYPNLY